MRIRSLGRPTVWHRASILIVAGVVAGCSAGNTRLATSQFNANGNQIMPPANVGATNLAAAPVASAPIYTSSVSSQPLQSPQVVQAPAGGANSGNPVVSTGFGQWNSASGAQITVQQGDTAYGIARRYGVPLDALLRTNGITNPSQIRIGQTLTLPRFSSGAGNTATASVPASGPAPAVAPSPVSAPASSRTSATAHVVAPGDTLFSLGRRFGVKPANIAAANGLPSVETIKVGQRLAIPAPGAAVAAPVQAPRPTVTASLPAAPVQAAAPVRPAPGPTAYVPPATAPAPESKPAAPSPQTSGTPQFQWPARGRVIATFGRKPNGEHNDGINLAVPQGAEVRAASDGTVAYAGSELRGYGNLILIRHENDYVTAYAHNSEILVSRGDRITKGQVIARAGQTGAVTSPQLHFEIRQGSRPIDPLVHLPEI